MNRTKINLEKFVAVLQIYQCKDGTLTVHTIEKLLYHLANNGDLESIEHGI